MRGGSRVGAGRKRGEESVRVRVPVGVLHEVEAIIAAYKQYGPKPKAVDSLKSGPEIEAGFYPERVKISAKELQAEMRKLERLQNSTLKDIRKKYGTLRQAVLAGVREIGGIAYENYGRVPKE